MLATIQWQFDTYRFMLDYLEAEEGLPIQNFVVLLPTSPIRNNDDIDNAIETVQNQRC